MSILSEYACFSNGKKRPVNEGIYPIYGGNGILGYADDYNMENGIIVGRVGVYCGSVFLEEGKCWVSDNAIKVESRDNSDLVYLYYLLKNLRLNERRIGTSQPLLTQGILNNIEVEVCDLDCQKKIAKLLEAIDKKIKNNNEINDNLLQQAEVLFKERFLNTDSLPNGWEIHTLGDVSDMTAGGDKPKIISDCKTDECPYPIYSNGISNEGLYGYTNDYKIPEESVTVSARGTIGYVCLRHIPFTPIVRLVTLIPHKSLLSAKYLYLWLKSIPIHGTGTTQQQLTVPDFRNTEIVIPSKESMMQFTETIDPLFRQIWSNQEQNARLANIRDTLLPKLMSGEFDVSNINF